MNKPLDKEKTPQPIPEPNRPMVYYMANGPESDDEINLLDLWRVLVRYKMLILVVSCLTTLTAIVYALMATPVYRAEVKLIPVGNEDAGGAAALMGQFGDLASLAGINLGSKPGSNKQKAMAILQSRSFTNKFMQDHNLLPQLFPEQWDQENQQWLPSQDNRIPNSWTAFKIFDSIRSVSENKKSGLVHLAIEWYDPQQATLWVNALVQQLNEEMRRNEILEAEKSISYLNEQLAQQSIVDVRQSIYKLVEGQIKRIMLANARGEFAFKVIDPAVVPQERVRPNRRMIVVLGFMVGVILSVFSAFIWSWLSRLREEAAYSPPP